jgi:hypothetical protein
MVAMAHPDIELMVKSVKESAGTVYLDGGRAIFAGYPTFKFSAECIREKLQPIANSEHRDAKFKDPRINPGMAFFEYRGRSSGKDNRLGRKGAQIGARYIVGEDLAIHTALPDATGDKLGVLGTEVKDCYKLTH